VTVDNISVWTIYRWNYVSLAFWEYSQVWGRCWSWRENC